MVKEINKNRPDELGERLKSYEAITTRTTLMPNTPIYARIDGRAFHTFCKGLPKPFCMELVEVMQKTCQYLVQSTNALLGYTQSDEISLCWLDSTKAPFEGKLFKLQSVLASTASSYFVQYIMMKRVEKVNPESVWNLLAAKCVARIPAFDCRIFNVPNEMELANCFVWRENDACRNSIQMLGQANFPHARLQGVSCKEIQNVLLEEKGINWNGMATDLKRGAYFQRENFEEEIPEDIWVRIPEFVRPENRLVTRSRVVPVVFGMPVSQIANKVEALFYRVRPIKKEYTEE